MLENSRVRPLALALVAAALAAPAAMPAHAAQTERNAVEVQYRDLNLTTEEGQRTLEQRLDRAARDVCGIDDRTTGSRLPNRGAATCYRTTRAQLAEQFAELVENDRRG